MNLDITNNQIEKMADWGFRFAEEHEIPEVIKRNPMYIPTHHWNKAVNEQILECQHRKEHSKE